LVSSVLGCADLDTMAASNCGNKALDDAEDCDTFAPSWFPEGQCRQAGQPAACRLDCSPDDDGNRPLCPPGWRCGYTDGVCRSASGSFENDLPIADVQVDTPRLLVGDIDVDHYDDVLTQTSSSTWVHYLGDDGRVVDAIGLPAGPVAPVLGDLTPRDELDIANPLQGLMVHRGQSDRVPLPTVYASLLLNEGDYQVVALDARPEQYAAGDPATAQVQFAGDELLLMTADGLYLPDEPAQEGFPKIPFPVRLEGLLSGLPVADLDQDTPCDEIVLAQYGGSEVHVVTPCKAATTDGQFGWNDQAGADGEYARIALPPGRIIDDIWSVSDSAWFEEAYTARVFVVDVDRDGKLDIVLPAVREADLVPELCVAFSEGARQYSSTAVADDANPGEANVFGCAPIPFVWPPVAVGHLNLEHDEEIDFVLPVGLAVSQRVFANTSDERFWIDSIEYHVNYGETFFETAFVTDLNANGFDDVVGFGAGKSEIVFLNGDGRGAMAEFRVPTHGTVRQLRLGDFDGDLLQDIAIFERREEKEPQPEDDAPSTSPPSRFGEEWLTVAYGAPFGAPEPPVELGKLGTVSSTMVADFKVLAYDANDDLLVALSTGGEWDPGDPERPPELDGPGQRAIALLAGATDRTLLSPFYFIGDDQDGEPVDHRPFGLVIGNFDGDASHRDLAVLTLPADEQGAMPEPTLWLLPSTGEAEIDASRVRPTKLELVSVISSTDHGYELLQPLVREGALMAAVDLDRDGIDEVVTFSSVKAALDWPASTNEPVVVGMPHGSISVAIAEAAAGEWQWREQAMVTTDELYFAPLSGSMEMYELPNMLDLSFDDYAGLTLGEEPMARYDGQIEVRDVDGDGYSDVVVLRANVNWNAWQDQSALVAGTSIALYPNTGSLSVPLEAPYVLEPPGGESPTGFCFLNLDDDEALEMAVLTEFTIWVGELTWDHEQRVARLEPAKQLERNGGLRIASGDFNADGVDDLAVADFEQVRLLLGIEQVGARGDEG
jgi:hypothetical protein